MNYYFLIEDEKSFLKILPKWIQYEEVGISRVQDIKAIENNNYVLQSGQGVTQLVTCVIYSTIDTILENPGKIDKLVIIVDAEELEIEERREDVIRQIEKKYKLEELPFEVHIFVCNRCIETWLLGCEGIIQRPVAEGSCFYSHYIHYDVELNDPEKMTVPADRSDTTAHYHFQYLHDLFLSQKSRERRYTKKKPEFVSTENYYTGIKNRCNNSQDINSFREFLYFLQCERCNNL